MPTYSDEKQRLRYFVPNEFIVFTEHSDGVSAENIAEAVRGSNLIQANIKQENKDGKVLVKPVINAHNVLTITFNDDALKRDPPLDQPYFKNLAAGRKSFSLVFVDVEASEDQVINIIDTLGPQLWNSGPEYQPAPEKQLTIQGITPNWLLSSAPPQEGGGGPGKRPVPPAANPLEESQLEETSQAAKAGQGGAVQKREFHDLKQAVAQHPSATKDREVDVIILDTAPSCAAYEHAQRTLPSNHPLHTLAQKLHIYHATELSIDLPTNYRVRDHNYKMSDHGLFVASIINKHAPEARLHLLQVLNDYGLGTIKTILGGLLSLYHYTATDLKPPLDYNPFKEGGPVVINLSLMLDLPRLDGKGQDDQLFAPHPKTDLSWKNLGEIDFVERMGRSLEVVLEWVVNELFASEVTIVAAAGNDGREKDIRRVARYPAAYKSVTGIGAKGKDDEPTEYSNLSDEPTKEGFLVFGGEPDENDPEYADPVKGVLGVYIGDFPRVGDSNKHGMAMWAGTSFACPRYVASLAETLRQGLSPTQADDVAKTSSVTNTYGERLIR